MKVRLLRRAAGPEFQLGPGAILDLPEADALRLIADGAAESAEAPETATIEPAETGVKATPTKRKVSDVR